MKEKEKCIKCGANNWKQTWKGFGVEYKCKKCGYVFDWIDYITAGEIQTKSITANEIKTNLI